jgi:hypothetical protein
MVESSFHSIPITMFMPKRFLLSSNLRVVPTFIAPAHMLPGHLKKADCPNLYPDRVLAIPDLLLKGLNPRVNLQVDNTLG